MAKKTVDLYIPHGYYPRWYQEDVCRAIDPVEEGGLGYRRGFYVCHRRGGKTMSLFAVMAKEAAGDWNPPGQYYYLFPTFAQARKVLWDGRTNEGLRFIDMVPREFLEKEPNNTEMKLNLKNGSIIQLVGTDNWDSLMGSNPLGLVFDEFSLQNPAAWEYLSPILEANGGWALFSCTPRGKNHAHKLFQSAQRNSWWFSQLWTIRETGLITEAQIERLRAEGKDEAILQQEYYCSWEGSIRGAYFAKQIARAREEGRVGSFPIEPGIPIDTYWDIGVDDATSIWFIQTTHFGHTLIDYFEDSDQGLEYYADVLRAKSYNYGAHYAPHDIRVRDWSTGISRWDTARKLGLIFSVVPRVGKKQDSIEAARNIFKKCRFNTDKCWLGLEALSEYQKEWNEETKVFKDKPKKGWWCHGSDAFQQFAMVHETESAFGSVMGDVASGVADDWGLERMCA